MVSEGQSADSLLQESTEYLLCFSQAPEAGMCKHNLWLHPKPVNFVGFIH